MRAIKAWLEGWLSVADEYDGEENYAGTEVEIYLDGPYLGKWTDVVRWLEQFDHERLTVEVLKQETP